MNRSLKSARPESSTYSTSCTIDARLGALAVAERDHLRALAGDVAGRHDPRQREPRHEPDAHRAGGREVGRRRSRPAAPAGCRDGSTPSSREQDLPARRDRGLGELQLAHVALGEVDRLGGVLAAPGSTKTRSSPIFVSRSASAGCSSAASSSGMKRPEWSSRPARTSSATQSTRPEPQMPTGSASPMTCSSSSSPSMRTPSIAPSAARIPQRICAASNAGPAGAAVASTRSCAAERDLAVRADVDEQAQAPVARQPGREQAGDDVAADVGAERREHERGRARVHGDAEVGRARRGQLVRGDDERRHRQRLGIDAERELRHRRVAAERDLVDLLGLDARLLAHLARRARRASPARASCSVAERVGVHHRRRDARDHVGAVGLLAVEHRAHRERLAGLEVEQRRDDRRRAEVERDRVAARRSCRRARRRSAPRRRRPP